MLPLSDTVLPLRRIAKYWSREIGNVRQSDEIFDELLSSFWLDTLHVTGASGNNKFDRHAILKLVNRRRIHPGFSLIESAEDVPGLERLPSGEITVDITDYIVLPADDATWTHDLVEAAYAHMSRMSFDDFDDLIKPGFRALCTTREALSSYCKAMGYPPPRFWFGPGGENQRWNSRREQEADAWFRELVNGPKEKPRSGYLADAQRRFLGMPEDAFDRIWQKRTPPEWKKPGPVVRLRKVQTKA
jgi:hypothetical protein